MNCKNLTKNENGYVWTINNNHYCTNLRGNGLFKGNNTYGKQIEGTLDFSLLGLTKSGARKKINRYFNALAEAEAETK